MERGWAVVPTPGSGLTGFLKVARSALLAGAGAACLLAATAGSAAAAPADPFNPQVEVQVDDQSAGAHPNMTITLKKPPNQCLAKDPADSSKFINDCSPAPIPSKCRQQGSDDRTDYCQGAYREQQFKKLVATLPPGLAPDPNAAPPCVPEVQPVASDTFQDVWFCRGMRFHPERQLAIQIGTLTGYLSDCADGWPEGTPAEEQRPILCGGNPDSLMIVGKVYLGVPHPGEQARLVVLVGHVTTTSGVPFELGVKVNRSGAITAIADNMPDLAYTPLGNDPPRAILGFQYHKIGLMLWGKKGIESGHPLLTSPTSCGNRALTAEAQGYAHNQWDETTEDPVGAWGDGKTVTGLSANVPFTACDKVAYAPDFDLRLDTTAPNAYPAVQATIRQADGEATTQAVTTTFPKGFRINFDNRNAQCTTEQFQSYSCPDSSVIGEAVADSRLLPMGSGPLKGKVFLGPTDLKAGKVKLLANLANDWLPGGIDVAGDASLEAGGRLKTAFSNLPELPIRRFDLRLLGGKDKSLLMNPKTCGTKAVNAAFVSHSGNVQDRSQGLHFDCGAPELTVHLGSRRPGTHPSLSLKVQGTGLRSAIFKLPSGVRVARRLVAKRTYGILEFVSGAGSKDLKLVGEGKAKRKRSQRKARRAKTATGLVVIDQGTLVSRSAFGKRSNKTIGVERLPEDTTSVAMELEGKRDRLLTLPGRCGGSKSRKARELRFSAVVVDNDGTSSTPTAVVKTRCTKHGSSGKRKRVGKR